MIKKIASICFGLLLSTKIFACAEYWDEMYAYSIFSQEIANEPQYSAFLWEPYYPYYNEDNQTSNANIKSWQNMLGISYEDALYLVFKMTLSDLKSIIKQGKSNDSRFHFLTKDLIKNHKEALNYLVVAKELEPYMNMSRNDYYEESWYYYSPKPVLPISNLENYDDYISFFENAYKKSKNQELKMRYAYQLIRLAHYSGRYEAAIDYFNTYVAPMDYKSEMYYYALSQYAGALRGTGNTFESALLFFQVFTHSNDLKRVAMTSIRITDDTSYDLFIEKAKTIEEKNSADLMLGFLAFNDPVNSLKKIIARSPNAPEAKILIARQVSEIGSNLKMYGDFSKDENKRFPILEKSSQFDVVLEVINQQLTNTEVKNKSFWNIVGGYLLFLNSDYDKATALLNKAKPENKLQTDQIKTLLAVIDLARIDVITPDKEIYIYSKYKDILESQSENYAVSGYFYKILANRYYLQKDYAKSLMAEGYFSMIDDNPQEIILKQLEDIYYKKNKNDYELCLINKFNKNVYQSDNSKLTKDDIVKSYIHAKKSENLIIDDKLDLALAESKKIKDSSSLKVSKNIFGVNYEECYSCDDIMHTYYLDNFSFIADSLNYSELIGVLIKLKELGEGTSKEANKANFLLGTFYYNVSGTGYFREYLGIGRWGYAANSFTSKQNKLGIYEGGINMNTQPSYRRNTTPVAKKYYETAYNQTSDEELKAHLAFGLSKCELEDFFELYYTSPRDSISYDIPITNRKYFEELHRYKNTTAYNMAESNCLLFSYYVNNIGK